MYPHLNTDHLGGARPGPLPVIAHSRCTKSPSPHHTPSSGRHRICPAANACWVCGSPALPDKLVSHTCLNEAITEKESKAREVTDLIREATQESILETYSRDIQRSSKYVLCGPSPPFVIQFMRACLKIIPPRKPTFSSWVLSIVLEALLGSPFHLIDSVSL